MRVETYVFFFQAKDGIRDLVRSRGLGDVYKRQRPVDIGEGEVGRREDPVLAGETPVLHQPPVEGPKHDRDRLGVVLQRLLVELSLIHI